MHRSKVPAILTTQANSSPSEQQTDLQPLSDRSSPQVGQSKVMRSNFSSSFESNLSNLSQHLPGAIQMSVSRSSVVFDGQNTYVEAEEQNFTDGQWNQQRMEGVWAGDQSQAAIQSLARNRPRLTSRPKVVRPLPRGKR